MISLPRFAGACALLLVAACSSPSAHAPSSPTPSAPQGAPSASSSPEEEALAAYRAMWDVVVEASHEAETDPAELEKYAAGDAAELMRQGLEGIERPLQGAPTHDIEVLSAEPTAVEIRDCQDGSQWVEEGSPPSDEKNIRIDATITRDALSWQVTDMRNWGPETC
ncbi:hypothetical protein FZ103_10435 [Streptomonospora sp. PA3]|uniref:hypothetical protein n=1 Tax=Streptomonospora sp. PA3 TaxID=2607326 RepID=UPI0012DD0BF8|nr:hypothetical protein [Streptomonospora sp. PA3]MUL41587.1 hypothetical protein [Streptomonospora sp. PA3]